MASVPILGQLGGTLMPSATLNNPAGALAGGTSLGGINQGGNGANVSMVPTGTTGATGTGTSTLSPVVGTSAPVSSAGNTYAPVQAMAQTPVDGGTSQFASGTGLVGSVPTSAQSQDLDTIDPNVFSGSSGTTLAGGLNNAFGAGIGTSIADVLSTMGGSTDQAVQATIANTDLAAQQQMGNIQSQEAAGGVTPNSSTAALAESNFYNQVNSGLQSTISNEELSEEDTLLNTLMSAGSEHGSSPSLLSSVTGAIGDVGSVASSASSAVSALSPTSDTSWLDALGAL